MRIYKINKDTKSFKTNYVKYWITPTDYFVEAAYILEVFPIETPFEQINEFIFERLDEDYNIEDRGDYWEFIEGEEESVSNYEEDDEEVYDSKYDAIELIEKQLIKLFNYKEKVKFAEDDAYELDIEYPENTGNLFDASVVIKYNGEIEKYFKIKNHYVQVSDVLQGDTNVIYSLADSIHYYYYNVVD